MRKQLYPRPSRMRDKSGRHWHVDYDLIYDGGRTAWVGHYRTYAGARIAAFWNVRFASWGGNAILFDNKGVDS